MTFLPSTDPSFCRNPYPFLQAVRAQGSCIWDDELQAWLLPVGSDIMRILNEPWAGKDSRYASTEYLWGGSPLTRMKARWILMRDGEFHTRARKLLSPCFKGRGLAILDETSRSSVIQATQAVQSGQEFDLAQTVAIDVPFRVITRMVGLGAYDENEMRAWSRALFVTLEPGITDDRWASGEEAAARLQELLMEQLRSTYSPTDAVILAAARAAVRDGGMDEQEAAATLALMFIAGHETTTQMIGNCAQALIDSQIDLKVLAGLLSGKPNLVQEFWRYDSAVQSTMRVANEDVVVDHTLIRKGSRMILLFGAANRDPVKHAHPDQLDFDRRPRQNFGFGAGAHYCLGAVLAQLELRTLIAALAQRGTHLSEAGSSEWSSSITFRGPLSLPVLLT